jgi:hypothetical protein
MKKTNSKIFLDLILQYKVLGFWYNMMRLEQRFPTGAPWCPGAPRGCLRGTAEKF